MKRRFIIRYIYADGIHDHVYVDAKGFFDAVSYAKFFSKRANVTIIAVHIADSSIL